MNPIKFWLNNLKVKREKQKAEEREEYFKRVNKIRKYHHCQLKDCKTELSGLTYTCPYCHKEFCEKHRLPENHKCKEPRKPQEFKKGYGKKVCYGKEDSEEKRIGANYIL
jgi:predicted nucleic acid binding AN1-type Zn finger protein